MSLSPSGKNCELCIRGFFRLEQSDPTSADVCRPCNCHTAGTVNGSMECGQVNTNTNSELWMNSQTLVTPNLVIKYILIKLKGMVGRKG